MPGRPRILDEVKRASICALLAAGCSRRKAAEYIGCEPSTIGYLAARDRYFAKQIRQAEMQKEVRPLTNLMQASGRHWRAAAWLLDRQFPDRYARRQPDLMTRKEFRDAISSVVNIMIDTVSSERDRQAMHRRVNQVLNVLDATSRPRLESSHDPDARMRAGAAVQ